jgi:hypothetical protein
MSILHGVDVVEALLLVLALALVVMIAIVASAYYRRAGEEPPPPAEVDPFDVPLPPPDGITVKVPDYVEDLWD